MKEQYVGDVNDYRKYALLRGLTRQGVTLGVVWMLTPGDGRTDGNKLSYLDDPKQQKHDPELFDLLTMASGHAGKRLLASIEQGGVLPGAAYFNDTLPDDLAGRKAYFERCWSSVGHCDLIFFDPDNGLDVPSCKKGSKNSSKYLYRDELAGAYARGHSVLVYQHFAHVQRETFVRALVGEIAALCPGAQMWSFNTPHVVFLLGVHPSHHEQLGTAASSAAKKWPDGFVRGIRHN